MGQKAIIFHSTGARPEYICYPWLAERLRARGYAVEVPHHPGINTEPIRQDGHFLTDTLPVVDRLLP